MFVTIKLKDVLQKQKETVKQLKRNQNKIIVQGTKDFLSNSQIKELKDLLEEQALLRKNVVLIKTTLRKNIEEDIVKHIFNLSELKESLKCLQLIKDTIHKSTNSVIEVSSDISDITAQINSIETVLEEYNDKNIELEIIEPEMTLINSNI